MQLNCLVTIILSACLVQGCVDAAVTGAQVAYNHSSIQKSVSDQYISTQINRKLYADNRQFLDSNIDVATFNQEVLLTGQVATRAQRSLLENIAKATPDVTHVYNLTEVSPPTPALKRASDAWITTKVKSQLIAMNEIDPNKIKVITENGTVYLMGMVMQDQADIAIDIARNTDGVERVVKMFTYLRPSKV